MSIFVFVNRSNFILVAGILPDNVNKLWYWLSEKYPDEIIQLDERFRQVDATFGMFRFFGALVLDKIYYTEMKKPLDWRAHKTRNLTELVDYLKQRLFAAYCGYITIFTTEDHWSYLGMNLSQIDWKMYLDELAETFPPEVKGWRFFCETYTTDEARIEYPETEEADTKGKVPEDSESANTPEKAASSVIVVRDYQEKLLKIWADYDLFEASSDYPLSKLEKNLKLIDVTIEIVKFFNPMNLSGKEQTELIDSLLALQLIYNQFKEAEQEHLDELKNLDPETSERLSLELAKKLQDDDKIRYERKSTQLQVKDDTNSRRKPKMELPSYNELAARNNPLSSSSVSHSEPLDEEKDSSYVPFNPKFTLIQEVATGKKYIQTNKALIDYSIYNFSDIEQITKGITCSPCLYTLYQKWHESLTTGVKQSNLKSLLEEVEQLRLVDEIKAQSSVMDFLEGIFNEVDARYNPFTKDPSIDEPGQKNINSIHTNTVNQFILDFYNNNIFPLLPLCY